MIRKINNLSNRAKNLLVFLLLLAILISFATYAWYLDMRTVYTTSYELSIASTESLLISLDGKKWDIEVTINESNYHSTYEGNTNSWAVDGLIPVSSAGQIHRGTSRMIMYQKSGITATPGGYRLMASPVQNLGAEEAKGYIAFDIFIKNFIGKQYIKELNEHTEEAIYLTYDSDVGIASSGGVPGYGIENSLRVGFVQIGRVIGSEMNQKTITGITCSDTEEVTGICRDAVIWEPNDTAHAKGSIEYYNETCKKRTGRDIRDFNSYGGKCKTIKDGEYAPTYVITSPIKSSHHVDIYDGAAYNGYTKTTQLKEQSYFTDTLKELRGIDRRPIFSIAANSITKIRVYIWLEGQDIDNNSLAFKGNKISMHFAFTKDRFSMLDMAGDGYEPLDDEWKPVITLDPDIDEIIIGVGEELILPRATAIDKVSEDEFGNDITEYLTQRIQIINPVDINTPGVYEVEYRVSDWVGNQAEPVIVTVIVEENQP